MLLDLAAECDLDRDAFAAACATVPVDRHIEETRRLMSRVGAAGFPTFVLESGLDWRGVPHQHFAGDPQGFARFVARRVGPMAPPRAAAGFAANDGRRDPRARRR